MSDKHIEVVKAERIRSEIKILNLDLQIIRDTQLTSIKPSPPSPTLPKSPSLKPKSTSTAKARFSRLTTPFRLIRQRSHPKEYTKMLDDPATAALIARRGSADSNMTLVGDDTAEKLLEVLAPIVGGVQKLVLRVRGMEEGMDADDVRESLVEVCEAVLGLIGELEGIGQDVEGDQHDFEMRGLMLGALFKKIQAEIVTLEKQTKQKSLSISPTTSKSSQESSPMTLQSQNPFILHATSLTLTSSAHAPMQPAARRTSSCPKSIPGAENGTTPIGGFSAFAGTAQASAWGLNNVVRLASFQNSFLFSPSPVAVRRTPGLGLRA